MGAGQPPFHGVFLRHISAAAGGLIRSLPAEIFGDESDPTHPLFDMSGNGLADPSDLHKRWKCTPKYLPCRYAALEANVDINQESLLPSKGNL